VKILDLANLSNAAVYTATAQIKVMQVLFHSDDASSKLFILSGSVMIFLQIGSTDGAISEIVGLAPSEETL
jgi:hypothetical protein